MGGRRLHAGERFGALVLVSLEHSASPNGRVRSHWLCDCACGGRILVDSGNLRSGNTTRCQQCTSTAKGAAKTTHGHTRGRRASRVYTTWQSMRARCEDPRNKRYVDYGGRGISVCERWQTFELFFEDMGEPPTADHQIERDDNDKGYEPDNCRWATRYEQAQNKRNTRTLTYGGRTQTLSEWATEVGLKRDTLKMRLRKGWTAEEALQRGDLRRGAR